MLRDYKNSCYRGASDRLIPACYEPEWSGTCQRRVAGELCGKAFRTISRIRKYCDACQVAIGQEKARKNSQKQIAKRRREREAKNAGR